MTVLPLQGTRPRYLSSGHLLYGANGAIQVVAFDAARRRVVGTPSPVLTPGPILPSGDMQLDVTANGTLVYVPPVAATVGPNSLVWVDRSGQETPIASLPPRPFAQPQLSRDGLRPMLSDVGQGDIRGLNVASPTLYRITDDAASYLSSTWHPDGRVVFASTDPVGIGCTSSLATAPASRTADRRADGADWAVRDAQRVRRRLYRSHR